MVRYLTTREMDEGIDSPKAPISPAVTSKNTIKN